MMKKTTMTTLTAGIVGIDNDNRNKDLPNDYPKAHFLPCLPIKTEKNLIFPLKNA